MAMSSIDPVDSQTPRNRSVNDYATEQSLRRALLSDGKNMDSSSQSLSSVESSQRSDASPLCDRSILSYEEEQIDESADWFIANADSRLSVRQSVDSEVKRLLALKSYMILDRRDCSATFDQLASIASRACSCPLAAISLLDLGRQWFVGRTNGDLDETPRKVGFCSHTIIHKKDLFLVPDATQDERFKDNPFVTGSINIRFYAGVPLTTIEGYKIGTVAVIDFTPRPEGLSKAEQETLKGIADAAMNALISHRTIQNQQKQLESAYKLIAGTSHDLMTPLSGAKLSISVLQSHPEFTTRLSPDEREIFGVISGCTDEMNRICQGLRQSSSLDIMPYSVRGRSQRCKPLPCSANCCGDSFRILEILRKAKDLIASSKLKGVSDLQVSVAPDVPANPIVGDESKVFKIVHETLKLFVGKANNDVCVKSDISIKLGTHPQVIFEFRPSNSTNEDKKSGENVLKPSQFLRSVTLSGSAVPETRGNHTDGQRSSRVDSVARLMSSVHGSFGTLIPRNMGCAAPCAFWFAIPLIMFDSVHELSVMKRDVVTAFDGPSISQEMCKKQRKSRTALVIDDSIIVRKAMSRALSTLGYDAKQARDGMEGLQYLKQSCFDVVFCDFLMPVMDGLDCVREYRKWERQNRFNYHQFIVGMSAHATEQDATMGLRMGMDEYEEKPITLESLRALERRLVNSADMPEQTTSSSKQSSGEPVKTERNGNDVHACLVAADPETCLLVKQYAESLGWFVFTTSRWEDAVASMKSRNWSLVFIDEEVPASGCMSCVHEFRKWEKENRVRHQSNVYLFSGASTLNNNIEHLEEELPHGIDGVISRPVNLSQISRLFVTTAKSESRLPMDIITR